MPSTNNKKRMGDDSYEPIDHILGNEYEPPTSEDGEYADAYYYDDEDDGYGSTDGYGLAGFVDAHTRMAFQGRNRLKGGRNTRAVRYACCGYYERNNYFQW
ncbi:hypothetical protein FA15DRAFT_655668 [Coprinopsis marcescibilis]|uniref:Uncharacterized protein n=1 Tax=Coprinopsis marcescibilis TaxID=230819 RepID=A0A5C3KW93_COPMA|nr:hypothetical protein FA15DRAFT_655668 [Coprinopsis marcescibilis]